MPHLRSARCIWRYLDLADTLDCPLLGSHCRQTACRAQVSPNTTCQCKSKFSYFLLTITSKPIRKIPTTRMKNAAKMASPTMVKTVNSVVHCNTNHHAMICVPHPPGATRKDSYVFWSTIVVRRVIFSISVFCNAVRTLQALSEIYLV